MRKSSNGDARSLIYLVMYLGLQSHIVLYGATLDNVIKINLEDCTTANEKCHKCASIETEICTQSFLDKLLTAERGSIVKTIDVTILQWPFAGH